MRRTLRLLAIVCAAVFSLCVLPRAAKAQDEAPKLEVFGGYSFMRANVVVNGLTFNLNGGSGSVAYNVNNWFGVVGDVGGYYQGSVTGNPFNLAVVSYMFGPRISWRWHNPENAPITPFAQALFGGASGSGTLYTTSLGGGAAPLGANTGFAFSAGGGVDWNFPNHKGVAIRVFQAEYFYTGLLNGTNNRQNNFRLSSGVIFRLGKR